jgi:glycosyltransferase involved in cell wall biosynthesis
VVFFSRLHHKKGLDLLLPAFARCGVESAVLALVGPVDDDYRTQLEAMIRAHNLRDRVVFTGMLRGPERVAALADADLFCLPSYQENFGIAVVEALAAGTPVLISDQVNIHPDIAAAGVGGVVPTRVEPLAVELRRWLTDQTLRDDAAAKCRPFVWQRYDWNAIARRWSDHYHRIAGAGR